MSHEAHKSHPVVTQESEVNCSYGQIPTLYQPVGTGGKQNSTNPYKCFKTAKGAVASNDAQIDSTFFTPFVAERIECYKM